MFLYWMMLALVFGYAPQEARKPEELTAAQREASLRYERSRQESIRVNELAAHINSEADARAYVDAVADMFAEILPPSWSTRGIRERIAHAEYEAVSDPFRQIPEQRIANVWNKYVREIGASEEALVTAAEIHNMRDATFAVTEVMWLVPGNDSERVDHAEHFRRWHRRKSGGGLPRRGGASHHS
jgi:hypothetical protein